MDTSTLTFLYKAAKEHLEIDLPASEEEVKKHFRVLSKIKYPDHGGDAREFQLLKETYDLVISMQGVVEVFRSGDSNQGASKTSDGYSIFDLGKGLPPEKNGVTCTFCFGRGYSGQESEMYRCFPCAGTGEIEVWNSALPKMRLW